MSDIYSMFRKFINDDVTDYSMPDLEALKFLDAGINKLSSVVDKRVIEEITIDSTDLTNGYVDLTNNCVLMYYTDLPYEGKYWQMDGLKKIVFWDTDFVSEGTYTFNYRTTFKTFDGVLRDNSYFDYDRRADLGIVFWALAEYQAINGIISPNGTRTAVVSKSEEGLSESYSSSESISLSSPEVLKQKAMDIFRSLNNNAKFMFSVTV